MKLSVTKSGNACGAEIEFDLSAELDDRTFAEIEQAFHDNIVVCFRGQRRGHRASARNGVADSARPKRPKHPAADTPVVPRPACEPLPDPAPSRSPSPPASASESKAFRKTRASA